MKNLVAVVLSTILCLGTITPTFASEGEEPDALLTEQELTVIKEKGRVPDSIDESITAFVGDKRDIISILVGNLDPKDYGGIYAKGDDYYIKVINKENIENLMENIKSYTPEEYWGIFDSIHFDEDVKYSLEQLTTASDVLWDAQSEGKISFYSTAVSQMNNEIVVEITEDTSTLSNSGEKDFAEELSKITGLDTENFKIDYITIEPEETEPTTEKIENRSSLDEGRCGDPIFNITSTDKDGKYQEFTIGSGIYYEIVGKSGGKYGWITAGHGCVEGDEFKKVNDYVGSIDFINLNEGYFSDKFAVADVAIINKDSDSDLDFSLNFFDPDVMADRLIGVPCYLVDGEEVYLLGGKSGKKKGEVENSDYRIPDWQGEGAKEYRYMIKTDIQSVKGDSGGPLVKKLENGHYALGGFLKGRSDNQSIYTSWRSVESRLRWVDRNGKIYNVKVWQHP